MATTRKKGTRTRNVKSGSARSTRIKGETVAQAFIELLAMRGIECFFGNPGTDFASIVEAFAFRQAHGKEYPRPLAIPHEIPLVSMAHGFYLATGRPQAAMVHVGVGTANALGPIIAAHRARVPVLFSAGRTPITEKGYASSRSTHIHWGQESFDQAGMVREYVKWDYELRTPTQLEEVVDRALTIALSEPRGPVYLTLPREVLAATLEEVEFQAQRRYDLPTFQPDPAKIQEAAALLERAQFPLIITSSLGRSSAAVQALIELAEAGAVGVVSFNPEYMNFPTEHPCHQGFVPDHYLSESDVILVIDSDVPWYPNTIRPRDSAVVIQAGVDPLYTCYPIRSFPSDLTLQGDPATVLSEITKAMMDHPRIDKGSIENRRKRLREAHDEMMKGWHESAHRAAADTPLDSQWISYNVNRILEDDTVVVNEYDNSMKQYANQHPGTYFCSPHAGYLGWGLGASLGIKLASPNVTVIATVGDGSYFFSVPSTCHFVSNAYQIPILIVVYNNQSWDAIKRATRALHPDGLAARTNLFPFSSLQPAGQYEKICEAFGGYGERVESPEQVGPALKRALHAVESEKRQALLNMICKST